MAAVRLFLRGGGIVETDHEQLDLGRLIDLFETKLKAEDGPVDHPSPLQTFGYHAIVDFREVVAISWDREQPSE